MATFSGDWTESQALHASAALANAASDTDDIDLATLGAYAVFLIVKIVAAAGSPSGDVTIEVFGSTDSGSEDSTIPVLTRRINFSGTGTKSVPIRIEGVPYAPVKVSNATGESVTHSSSYAYMKQTSV